jgi:uncharacterized repeat protein (TIGR03837 family)
LRWDLYCRVIDNFGDAGVCWRLAADLAGRGDSVRLVIDDAAPLAFMAPQGAPGVAVFPWPGPQDEPGDVLVEAFGCDPPPERVAAMAAMAARARSPVWINLEYLSAEGYVERSHGLPSPQACGLTKWFFFPGFTRRTGGLLREPALMAERTAFDRHAWLAQRALSLRPGERVVSLFCYDNPRLPALLDALAAEPTLLLLTPGHAQRQVQALMPPGCASGPLRAHALPWLDQPDFDRMLWAGDLNFVRGEDSLVRALWAGAPCVWQIYPQDDGVHAIKLQALLEAMAAPPDVAALWRVWNGLPGSAWPVPAVLPTPAPWARVARDFQRYLLGQDDLSTQLRAFVHSKQGTHC